MSRLWKDKRIHALGIIANFSSVFLYLPFFLTGDADIFCRRWGGPLYVFVAKTVYIIDPTYNPFPNLSPRYFAAQLICYPRLIRAPLESYLLMGLAR
jgi:hypothetical protein